MRKVRVTFLKYFGNPNEKYDYLYHFYIKGNAPFRSIMDMRFTTVEQYVSYALENDLAVGEYFDRCYFERRLLYEALMRKQFIEIGGEPVLEHPYYCTLGYGKSFNQHRNKSFVRIPINRVDTKIVSFTYGDSFPTFNEENANCQREYFSKVYDYNGIMAIIKKYGSPGIKNKNNYGYETYIEAQIWDDNIIKEFV